MTQTHARTGAVDTRPRSPWPALWALIIGFFMILVDTTIVAVANPAIKAALDPGTANLDNVVWVTSAYLLAYAVPLLITGTPIQNSIQDVFALARFLVVSGWCSDMVVVFGAIVAGSRFSVGLCA